MPLTADEIEAEGATLAADLDRALRELVAFRERRHRGELVTPCLASLCLAEGALFAELPCPVLDVADYGDVILVGVPNPHLSLSEDYWLLYEDLLMLAMHDAHDELAMHVTLYGPVETEAGIWKLDGSDNLAFRRTPCIPFALVRPSAN